MTSLISVIPKKILIIQLRQLGDVILTTPLVRQVRKFFPNAEIHFLTEKLGSHVYENNKYIDKLIVMPGKMSVFALMKFYLKIRQENFNLVIDAFGNPKSAQLTFFSGAQERVGFAFKWRKFAYNKTIESNITDEYSAITKLRLISYLNPNLEDFELDYPLNKIDSLFGKEFFEKHKLPKKTIAFHVVSRRGYKIWDKQYFIELGNWFIEQGVTLLFTYGFGELNLAKEVYDGLSSKKTAFVHYPVPTLGELKSVLKECLFYIGNDGGVKHLAICADIPTFTIFKNINAHNWTPPNSPKHFALMQNEHDKHLTAKHVIEEVKKFLIVNKVELTDNKE